MLKLFMLEREESSECIKITFLIAADCEKSARKIAAENAIIAHHRNLWLKPKKEKVILLSQCTMQASYCASCKEIGIANKGILSGIMLTLKTRII